MSETQGANNNERLLAAARSDNEDMLLEVFEEGEFDINFQDGLGNTALHYAAIYGSTDVLEHILSHDECDVDPVNRLAKATPLHLATQIKDLELRKFIIESLLEAGANTYLKDKHGDTALDLLPSNDQQTRSLFQKARAEASVSKEDFASDDEDGSAGSGSGSE